MGKHSSQLIILTVCVAADTNQLETTQACGTMHKGLSKEDFINIQEIVHGPARLFSLVEQLTALPTKKTTYELSHAKLFVDCFRELDELCTLTHVFSYIQIHARDYHT